MELKDVILSTLAELDDIVPHEPSAQPLSSVSRIEEPVEEEVSIPSSFINELESAAQKIGSDDEVRMLEGIRERLLVLFEGFQSPNNVNIEAKVDLTLNFFEYLLATIDSRLETIRT